MNSLVDPSPSVADVAAKAAEDLVHVSHRGGFSYINLPIFLPSGSAATVRISRVAGGFRVDDGGFAYRELESIGAERSFARTARKFAAREGLETDRSIICVTVPADGLVRAIGDVAMASYAVADDVYRRAALG